MRPIDFRKRFYEQLETRNVAQREAIEAIDGPLMVIAGPGTGKTDVLGLRIGNILEKTDTAIQNILCLTFTESGAVEMRRRLGEYIGPAAYNAQVFTFHGFCNMVIQENLPLFRIYRESQAASELEQFQVLKEIIDELPLDSPLKRFTGRIYYETKRLLRLFSMMKQEEWPPDFMHRRIDNWIAEQRESDQFRYKKRTPKGDGTYYVAGDFKERDFESKVINRMSALRAAVDLFDRYNEKLRALGRYDYHDMLLWVRDSFRQDETLLAMYQERYQYVLVDEFQDTNGIQLTLLELLASHWHDRPDVFVVGDDDQAIFRFQGATMQNITAFKERFDPQVVVLTENYRSTQTILDAASSLIAHNTDRLVNRYPEYSKDLKASAEHAGLEVLPEVRIYANWTQEQAAILAELQELYDSGKLREESVAVIYRQHKQVDGIVHALEAREVPVNVKKPVNVLDQPVVRNILSLLRYLQLEARSFGSGEYILHELLHFRYFGLSPRDVGKLATGAYKSRLKDKLSWREVMGDPDILAGYDVRNPDAVIALDNTLESWLRNRKHWTLLELVERVLTESGILGDVFGGSNMHWHLQVIKTFFEHVREETFRQPDLELESFIEGLDTMIEHGIELPLQKVLTAPDGIHFVTAHSAKGMQFDKVYIIGCDKRAWGNKGSNQHTYTLPDLSPSSEETDEQDERRLFYVAMTRARKELYISHSLLSDEQKEMEGSRFVEELRASNTVRTSDLEIDPADFATFAVDLMKPVERPTPLIDHALIERALEGFEMSLTALNAYLECPRKFYFENIIRVPSAPRSYFGFGRAIHDALHEFFNEYLLQPGKEANADQLVALFEKQMPRYRSFFTSTEFDLQVHYGSKCLESFFNNRIDEWRKPEAIRTEFKINNVHHNGVPLKGYLDRLDMYSDHVVVTDYKTGKYDYKKAKPPGEDAHGGNYWRQIVFYKILLNASPGVNRSMTHGYLDFVEPDKDKGVHKKLKIAVQPEDEAVVSEQIRDTYDRILNHEFENGCEDENCYWCNLVNHEMRIDPDAHLPELSQEEFIDISN